MRSKNTPAPADCQFLDAVAVVAELESGDAELAEASRNLWRQLALAEETDWIDTMKRLAPNLFEINELRREIAEAIAKIRADEA